MIYICVVSGLISAVAAVVTVRHLRAKTLYARKVKDLHRDVGLFVPDDEAIKRYYREGYLRRDLKDKS